MLSGSINPKTSPYPPHYYRLPALAAKRLLSLPAGDGLLPLLCAHRRFTAEANQGTEWIQESYVQKRMRRP